MKNKNGRITLLSPPAPHQTVQGELKYHQPDMEYKRLNASGQTKVATKPVTLSSPNIYDSVITGRYYYGWLQYFLSCRTI